MWICVNCDKTMVDWFDVVIAELECDCCGVKRFCRYKEEAPWNLS